jgi:hypothetical protein
MSHSVTESMQKPKFQDIFHPFQLCAFLLTEALKLMGVQSLMRSRENESDRLVNGEMNRTIHALILGSSQILAQFYFDSLADGNKSIGQRSSRRLYKSSEDVEFDYIQTIYGGKAEQLIQE